MLCTLIYVMFEHTEEEYTLGLNTCTGRKGLNARSDAHQLDKRRGDTEGLSVFVMLYF